MAIVPGCINTGAAQRSYPHPRSGVAAERSYLISKEELLRGCRRAKMSYPMPEVRGSD